MNYKKNHNTLKLIIIYWGYGLNGVELRWLCKKYVRKKKLIFINPFSYKYTHIVIYNVYYYLIIIVL